MMKTVQKRVFRHVEHLRLLHMPLFAFLEQISKIDDENSAKTRFSACWTFANAAYAYICVPYAVFRNWWWKQCKNTIFGMLNTCDHCICFFCVSRANFRNCWWKQCKNAFFQHVEHLPLLLMPLFAFLKQFLRIDDENTAKTRFLGMVDTCDYCICLYLRF